jgi:hypothetical protein
MKPDTLVVIVLCAMAIMVGIGLYFSGTWIGPT